MFDAVNPSSPFPEIEEQVLDYWRKADTFQKSLQLRRGAPTYVFYEGPPTANGRPGVHHVQARAYKDLFPRYKTMRGFQVPRKAGWDCHGLPVELEVEKKLGFSGKKAIEDYGIEPFNKQCRASVMEYEGLWGKLTERMGYWCDLDHAYMTMSNDFVESVWWSLKELWDKKLLYLGYKVVPYCAKDGTPLSSHEVGLGYKDVRDPSVYVRFPLRNPQSLGLDSGASLMVWTTTPWTLPGNVAAAVNPKLTYVAVRHGLETLILAESLVKAALQVEEDLPVVGTWTGAELAGQAYSPPYKDFELPENAHRIVTGDFVTASDGCGIVHIAPAFGADDLNVAREYDLPVIHSVDTAGHFVPEVQWLAGKWFKDGDALIVRDLKERKLLYRKADYVHSYPHCWRCQNPLMYYATDSWFIRNTSMKEQLIAKNQEIDWHPAHIKNGRYGDWLNNLVDWALSRTRYWGTPLPIWECECGHKHCIGSYTELSERATEPLDVKSSEWDPHRPYIDRIKLRCPACAGEMNRVPDVIDCWYDSGSMPFAQLHYPFENQELFKKSFPADYICEGLDQTRGWFNSLHQLGVMLFDSIAYKSVICHGLVLDGEGEKMSKTRGNVVDPWEVLNSQGADSLRWYLYASAPPEVSRRFSAELVGEASRRHLSTLWNTYSFFVLNANAAKPDFAAAPEASERLEIDRWVLARLNQLIVKVTRELDRYELTPAARELQEFVDELSNWYVRRNRRRFWNGDPAAFATLYECLLTVAQLMAPFTPFLSDAIYRNLRSERPGLAESVHLSDWPEPQLNLIDEELIASATLTLKAVSLGRAARTLSGYQNRQPLAYALLGARSEQDLKGLKRFATELQDELNVKELRFLDQRESFLNYTVKPNLPLLGKKLGKQLPMLRKALAAADGKALAEVAHNGGPVLVALEDGTTLELTPEELLIEAHSPEGYSAQEEDGLIVALTTAMTPELIDEGTARGLVRNINDLRKTAGLEISDRIELFLPHVSEDVARALVLHRQYVMDETLTDQIHTGKPPKEATTSEVTLNKTLPKFTLGVIKASEAKH
jgi:isoleucyl-tRNA synthetase